MARIVVSVQAEEARVRARASKRRRDARRSRLRASNAVDSRSVKSEHCPVAQIRPTTVGDSPLRPTAAHKTSVEAGSQNCDNVRSSGAVVSALAHHVRTDRRAFRVPGYAFCPPG